MSTFTNLTKNASSATNLSKNNASFSNESKSLGQQFLFLIDDTYKLLIDETYSFDLGESSASIVWSNLAKS